MRARHGAMTVEKVRNRQSASFRVIMLLSSEYRLTDFLLLVDRESDRHDFLAGFLFEDADASDAEMTATARTRKSCNALKRV